MKWRTLKVDLHNKELEEKMKDKKILEISNQNNLA